MVVAFSKTYPACQTDDNGIKPGSNLTNADKRAAEPSRAEFLGIKLSVFNVLNDSYKNVPRISSLLGKIVIFLYTGKIIQVLDFNNWHPLKSSERILLKV